MKQLLTILFFVICWLKVVGQEIANKQLRYDGVYATKPYTYSANKLDSVIELLRFYKEGYVIHWSMWPTNKNWIPDSLMTFNKEHILNQDPIYRPIGKYKIANNKVRFIIKTKMTRKIKYKGNIINDETLEVTRLDIDILRKSKYTYYFIPYKR